MQVLGLDSVEVTPAPSNRRLDPSVAPELRDLLRAERELSETFTFSARSLGLLLMKGTLNALQDLTQTAFVLRAHDPVAAEAAGTARRSVDITGMPEDVADAAGRLRFITDEIARVEREAAGGPR